MTNGEKRDKVLNLYTNLIDLQTEENSVSKRKRAVKDELSKLIPAGQRVAGVKRTVVEGKTTSWKAIAEHCKAVLIPKTKWDAYAQIVFGNTKDKKPYDQYSVEED